MAWQVALSGVATALYLAVWVIAFWSSRQATIPVADMRRFDRGVRVARVNIYLPVTVTVFEVWTGPPFAVALWCWYTVIGVVIARMLRQLRNSYQVRDHAYAQRQLAQAQLSVHRRELADLHQRNLDAISGIVDQLASMNRRETR